MNNALKIHVAAALVATLTILAFLLLAIGAELVPQHLAAFRRGIAWGLLLLVPALMATGLTGHLLARRHRGRLVADKVQRMQIVAANGLLVLVPSALFLAFRAGNGQVEGMFRVIQLVEIAAGATNFCLLLHNLRDGMRLSGRWSRNLSPTARVIRRA
jgi:hypothetical protein